MEAILTAIERCWDVGSPVARSNQDRISRIALRRLESFERRSKKSTGRLARVKDLKTGLIQSIEDDPKLVGPLEMDCQFLAEAIYDAWQEAPWIRACQLHPVGELRTVHAIEVAGFGLFVRLADTDIPGLLLWINVPAGDHPWIRSITAGEQIEVVVLAHPDHHRQIWLERL